MNKNSIKNLWEIFLLLLFFSCGRHQDDAVRWAKQAGGENYDGGRAIALDCHGNICVVCRFQGSMTVDGVTLTGKGDDGVALMKFTPEGALLWAKQAGGKKEDSGYSLSIDSQDNIYLAGYFSDTAFFDNHQLISSGEFDAFLAKFSPDGNILWVRKAGGALKDKGKGAATDNYGNCFFTGFFTGTMYLDTFNLTSHSFHEDIFIAKYDSDGKILWAKKAGGNSSDRAEAIAADKIGNCYITGSFDEKAFFDTIEINSEGNSDIFIARYDGNGNALWARCAGGPKLDEARSIAVDAQNNVYVTGFFVDNIKLQFFQMLLTSMGDRDMFVVSYSSDGDFQWARQGGGSGIDEGSAVVPTLQGGCFVTGFFGQNATFGDTLFSTAGDNDIFIAHYTPAGNLSCIIRAGSDGYDEGRAVVQDDKENIYITGNYRGVLILGAIPLPESRGDGDIFIAKMKHKH